MSEAEAASYQVLEELGSGSFGVVYKAIERSSGQIVAIKHVSISNQSIY
jgi:serine/threonine protein kinase